MDAVKFLNSRRRTCDNYPGCNGCEWKGKSCPGYVTYAPFPATEYERVKPWAEQHPRKTRQSVFLEQWPEANTDNTGVPLVLPCTLISSLRRSSYCGGRENCIVCRREFWGQEVE